MNSSTPKRIAPRRPGASHLALVLTALFATLNQHTSAGELSHYVGGSFNPRDWFVPDGGPAFIVAPYWAGYAARDLRDGAGEPIRSIGSANLDVEVSTWQFQTMFIGYTGKKILGANYGFMVMPSYGETTVAGRLSATDGAGLNFSSHTTGVADLLVQPVMLTWAVHGWDIAFNYAFWAPTGDFDPQEGGVGLGYWTSLFRIAFAYSLDEHRMKSFTMAVSYDINSGKNGVDVRPGDHLTTELGYNHVFSEKWQAGIFLWGSWQTTDDSGAAAVNSDVHDRLFGAGAYISYWLKPGKLGLLARYTGQFSARDQFQGDTVAAGINLVF